MNRTPPTAVRRELKREVGFGCPVPYCGNPYLYWHHFDPPWDVRQHHDPDGMIALCGLHHPKADAGAYSKEQLREFKRRLAERAEEAKGRFEWMRHSLLGVVGGNFYYETPVVFQFRGGASVGEFCSWVTPIAFLFAGMSAVVLAVGVQGEDRIMSLVAASLFVVSSVVGVVCFWGGLDG
jgi:hypothetical protein